MRKLLAASLAAAGAACGAASAQVKNPLWLVPNFDVATLSPFFAELGIPVEQGALASGRPAMRLRLGEIVAYAAPQACVDAAAYTRCAGLSLFAEMTWSTPLDSANYANDLLPGLVVIVRPGATAPYVVPPSVVIRRYLIGNFGITRGTLAAELTNFEGWSKQLNDDAILNASYDSAGDDFTALPPSDDKIYAPGASAPSDRSAAILNARALAAAASRHEIPANELPSTFTPLDIGGGGGGGDGPS